MSRRLNRVRSAAGCLLPSPRGLAAVLGVLLALALLMAPAALGDRSATEPARAEEPRSDADGMPGAWKNKVQLAIADSEYHVTWQHETPIPLRSVGAEQGGVRRCQPAHPQHELLTRTPRASDPRARPSHAARDAEEKSDV